MMKKLYERPIIIRQEQREDVILSSLYDVTTDDKTWAEWFN